jgi:hypothetical protein
MAKKKKDGVKAALRELAPGGISKSELSQIAKQTGASSQQIVKRMDAMNKAGQDVRLNSGAANMLIKQAQTTPSIFGQQPSFGTGNIGRALTGMMGSPGYTPPRAPNGGTMGQAIAATPAQLMIGGTQIRPGGRTAVRPMGAAPAVGDTAADTTAAAGDGTTTAAGDGTMAGDQYDFQSMLDALTAMQQPQFDMGALTDMFNTQFEQLSSQFDTMNPLQLAQLGRAYGSDAIRARQRMRKTRQDYRRGLPAMALGQALANLASMGIGGGVTL